MVKLYKSTSTLYLIHIIYATTLDLQENLPVTQEPHTDLWAR